MGLEKSQLFRVSDLAAVRNQAIPAKLWVSDYQYIIMYKLLGSLYVNNNTL